MIGKFAIKSLLADKLRCFCAVVSMILTAVLFSSLFTTVSGINKACEHYNIKKTGTDYHFIVKEWKDNFESTVDRIKKSDLVSSAGCRTFISYLVNDKLNYSVEVNYMDEEYSKHCYYGITGGKLPSACNEVAVDTVTLDKLGIEKKAGSTVVLDIAADDGIVTETFILSGWFSMNEAYSVKVGQVIVSDEFTKHWSERYSDNLLSGTSEIGVYLKAVYDIEDEAAEILEGAGAGSEIVNVTPNPAYASETESFSIGMAALLAGGILLVIMIGYLIIHNIFYISAKRDAKMFGRLKTIGMSNKSLAVFVRIQACCLMAAAIPVGIICGYFLGNSILPFVLRQTSMADIAGDSLSLGSDIIGILIFSVVFVILTTFISISGPVRMIKKSSPIESTRIELNGYKSQRKTTDGSRLHKFAFYNVLRSKKSLVLLVISIALPVLLVIISFDILCSFDMDKYISSMLCTDYTVATANYYKNEYTDFEGNVSALDEQLVEGIRNSEFYKNGSVIYGDRATDYTSLLNSGLSDDEEYGLNIYGVEAYAVNDKQLVEKNIDMEAFMTGSGVIIGCWLDNNGQIYPGTSLYDTGDTVSLKCRDGKVRNYTVLGHIDVSMGALTTKISEAGITCELYFSTGEYTNITGNSNIMSFEFDVNKSSEENAEEYMKLLAESMPFINYESKYSLAEELSSMKQMIRLISIMLCLVLLWIAVMNLVNVFISSILVRKKEIAAMRSIGMSRNQLRKMFLWEIFYYNGAAFMLAAVLSLVMSASVLKWFINEFSFLSFNIRWSAYPLILCVIMLIGAVTVIVAEKKTAESNIVEELKTL